MSKKRESPAQVGKLLVERDGYVAWVVMNRPEVHNALSKTMWADLPALVHELDADPTVRVIGLRGAGNTFSAGGDIQEILDCLQESETGLPSGGVVSAAERAIFSLRKPTIAALQGHCMGGAWMLAGACDLRIASRSLSIGITPARIGIIFPESGVNALVRLAGETAAAYLLLTGDTITADQASEWGMITRVIDDADFDERVQAMASGLSNRSQLAVQGHKYLIRRSAAQDTSMSTRTVVDALYREVLQGPDARVGREAFHARATPRFEWSGEKFRWQ